MGTETFRPSAPVKYDPVRAAALEGMVRVEQGEPIDDVIRDTLRRNAFRPIDVRFFMQLLNGAVKMRRRLDHEIKFYLAKPSLELPVRLANLLRLGFYQVVFMDKVPPAAAVSESVNLARRYLEHRQARLVNAVMRARLREPHRVQFIAREVDPVKHLADYYSFPDYFVTYCLREFGEEAAEHLLRTFNEPPRVTYRVNLLKVKADQVKELLQREGIPFREGKYLPEFLHIQQGGLPLEKELIETGKVLVQDESAGLAVRLLNPKPGVEVADLTAAPGGKATYAAIRMRNKGRLVAVDKSHQRLQILVENAKRLGIRIISPVVGDMAEFKGGPFDRVLLDPPCSGWGTAGKHADLRWCKTEQDIQNLSKIQAKMIDRAARLVKPGGVLVYSTCTIIRDENDQVVEEFLLRNPKFEIEHAGRYFDDSRLVTERGFVKTYPACDGMDGAFCARLRRKLKS